MRKNKRTKLFSLKNQMLLKFTGKPLSDSLVTNEVTVSVVRVTFSESLIDSAQVQVDSIIQVKRCRPIFLRCQQIKNNIYNIIIIIIIIIILITAGGWALLCNLLSIIDTADAYYCRQNTQ